MAITNLDGQDIAPEYDMSTGYPLVFTPTVPAIEGFNYFPDGGETSQPSTGTGRRELKYIAPGMGSPTLVNTAGETEKALERGVDILQSAGYGALGLVGKAVGSDSLAEYGAKGYIENMEQVQWNQSAVPTISDINGVGDFLTWAYSSTIEQIPLMASSIATGGVGAFLGTRAATKAGSSALASKTFQQFVTNELKDVSFDTLTDKAKVQLTDKFVKQAAAKSAQGYAFVQNAAIESGLNWGEVAQEIGVDGSSALSSTFFGTIGGFADMFGIEGNLLRRLTKQPVSEFADRKFKELGTTWLKKTAVKGALGAGSEAVTEGVQEIASILNTVAQIDGKVFFSAETAEQVFNALAAGAVGGGIFSAVTPAGQSPQQPQTYTNANGQQVVYEQKNPYTGLPQVTAPGIDAMSMYDEKERAIGVAQVEAKTSSNAAIAELKKARNALYAQRKQLKDVDPEGYKKVSADIKQLDKKMYETLAHQAAIDADFKEQRKQVQEARNKTIAGLNKEQQEKDYRQLQIQAQPVLSKPETQTALGETVEEIKEFSKNASIALKQRLKNIDSDIATLSQNGETGQVEALRKERANTMKVLSTLNKDAVSLQNRVSDIMSDSDLPYLATDVESFYTKYASSNPEMRTSAIEARTNAQQAGLKKANDKITSAQKELARQRSLIDKDTSLTEMQKALAREQIQRETRALEIQRGMMNATTTQSDIDNTVQAETEQEQATVASTAQADTATLQGELGGALEATERDIEEANQATTESSNEALHPTVQKTPPPSAPQDIEDAEIAVDNGEQSLTNQEVQQDVEEGYSNTSQEYQSELGKVSEEAVAQDAELGKVVDDTGKAHISPALTKLVRSVENFFGSNPLPDSTPEQVQQTVATVADSTFTQETREATAAHNVLVKTQKLPALLQKQVSKLPPLLQKMFVFSSFGSGIYFPVEVQNIFESDKNVSSIYHNGKIYVRADRVSDTYHLDTDSMVVIIETYKTAMKAVGLDKFLDQQALANLQQSTKALFPDFTGDVSQALTVLSDMINSTDSSVTQEQKQRARELILSYIVRIVPKEVKASPEFLIGLVDSTAEYYSSQDTPTRVDRTYVSTVNNTPYNPTRTSSLWGMYGRFAADIWTLLDKYNAWYGNKNKNSMDTFISLGRNLNSQSTKVKNVFMTKLRPANITAVDNGDGTFSARVAMNESSTASIMVSIDPKTGKPFTGKKALQNRINEDKILGSIPMKSLLELISSGTLSPKQLSKTLLSLGIYGAEDSIKEGHVLFMGDDVGLSMPVPNTDSYTPSVGKENTDTETVVTSTEVTTSTMVTVSDATKRRQQEYFEQQFAKTEYLNFSPREKAIYDAVEKFYEKFPYLRDRIVVTAKLTDARVPDYISERLMLSSAGVMDNTTGVVHTSLVALDRFAKGMPNASMEEVVNTVLIHESIVHLGLNLILTKQQQKQLMTAIKHAVMTSEKGSDLRTLYERFRKRGYTNKSTDDFVYYEEFLAFIAQEMPIEEFTNTSAVKKLFDAVLTFLNKFIDKLTRAERKGPNEAALVTPMTLKQMKDLLRGVAQRIQNLPSNDHLQVYDRTANIMHSVTKKPVEGLYIGGADFMGWDSLASAMGYSMDVMNSQGYAFGLINDVTKARRLTNEEVVVATDPVGSMPHLSELAKIAGADPKTSVKDVIDMLKSKGLTAADIGDYFRKADVKVVMVSKNHSVSLYTDTKTMFPRKNYQGTVAYVENNKNDLVNNAPKPTKGTLLYILDESAKTNGELIGDPTPTGENATIFADDLNWLQRAKESEYAKLLEDKTRTIAKDGSLNLSAIGFKLKENFLDRYNPVKAVERFFQKNYGSAINLTGDNSLHNLFSTSSNKVNAGKAYYDSTFINRVFGKLAKINLAGTFKNKDAHNKALIDMLDEYLFALHAEERNKSLFERYKGALGVAASGMSTEKANSIIDLYKAPDDPSAPDKWKPLREAAQLVQNLNRDVLDKLHENKMITDDDYNNTLATYKNYVPLLSNDVIEKIAPEFSKGLGGSSLSINKKKVINFATGRSSENVTPIFAQSILKSYASVDLIERNNLSRKLADIVRQTTEVEKNLKKQKKLKPGTSASAIWEMSSYKDSKGKPYRQTTTAKGFKVNDEGELVLPAKAHKFEGSNFHLITYLDENAQEQIIAIKDQTLGRSLKGENVAVPSTFVKYLGKATRQLARLMTGRNPVFIIVNPLRDIQQSLLSVSSALKGQELEGIFGASTPEEVKATIRNIRKNMMDTYKKPSSMKMLYDYFKATSQDLVSGNNESMTEFERKYTTNPDTAEAYDDFIDFLDKGGKTTVGDYLTLEETYIDLRKKLRKAQDGANHFEKAVGYLDTLSETSEASVRFATYAAFLQEAKRNINKMNISQTDKDILIDKAKELSARMALDSTVNFSRRGAKAGPMNALYAFSSAALQGGQRVINHLWREDSPRGDNLRRVSTYLGSFALAGLFMSQLASALMGDDEDGIPLYYKIPEHERMNNLIIPAPFFDGGYIKLPMPYGFSSLWSIGTTLHSVMSGFSTPSQGSVSLLNSMYSSVLPWDLPSEGFGTLIPTIARPFYQVSVNKTFTGAAIRPESTFQESPDSQKSWRTTPEFYKDIALFLNSITGGNEVESGVIDISPETIEHLASSYGAGLYRLLADSVALGGSIVADKYNPNPKVPVFSGVMGVVGRSGSSNIYYQIADKVDQARRTYTLVDESPDLTPLERREIKSRNNAYYSLLPVYNSTEGKIKKIRERMNTTRDSKQLDSYQKQIDALQKQFLKYANSKDLAPYEPIF